MLSHRTRSDIQGVAIHDYYFIERCLEGCPRGRLGTAITVVTVDRVDVETGRGEPVLEGFQSDCFFAFGGFGRELGAKHAGDPRIAAIDCHDKSSVTIS